MKIQDQIVAAIKEEPVIARHILDHHWTSGSSTVVYPITLWERSVCIQLDTHRDYFEKAVARVLKKHTDLFKDGYFCKNDDSCPAEIRFYYTDNTIDKLKQQPDELEF
jgi:hypothetical protein